MIQAGHESHMTMETRTVGEDSYVRVSIDGADFADDVQLAYADPQWRRTPAGQEQEPAEELRRRGRHVGVVPVQPDAEVRLLHPRVERERPLEGVLDPLAVTRGAELLRPQHTPLRPGAVRATEIEPGLGSLRFPLGPGFGGGDGGVDPRFEHPVERAADRVELHHRRTTRHPIHALARGFHCGQGDVALSHETTMLSDGDKDRDKDGDRT